MLYAIDQSKPPSIWRERMFYLLIGIMGGIGLGTFIFIFGLK